MAHIDTFPTLAEIEIYRLLGVSMSSGLVTGIGSEAKLIAINISQTRIRLNALEDARLAASRAHLPRDSTELFDAMMSADASRENEATAAIDALMAPVRDQLTREIQDLRKALAGAHIQTGIMP